MSEEPKLLATDIATELKNIEKQEKEENPGLKDKLIDAVSGGFKGLLNKFFGKSFVPESEPVKDDKEKRWIFLIDKIFSVLKAYIFANMLVALAAIVMNYPVKSIEQWILFFLSELLG